MEKYMLDKNPMYGLIVREIFRNIVKPVIRPPFLPLESGFSLWVEENVQK